MLKTFLVLTYVYGLDYAYSERISPIFSYMGHVDLKPLWPTLVFGFVMAVFPTIWSKLEQPRVSSSMYWLIYLTVYIPACIIPAHSIELWDSGYFLFTIVLTLNMYVLHRFTELPQLKLPQVRRLSPLTFYSALLSISVVTGFYVLNVTGLQFGILSNLNAAYAARELVSVRTQDYGNIGYLINFLGFAVAPFMMAVFIIRRQWIGLIVVFTFEFILLLASNAKAFIGIAFLIIFLAILSNTSMKNVTGRMLYLTVVFVWGILTYSVAKNDITIMSISVQRILVVPGLLTGYYYDFFRENEFLLLSHSVLSSLLSNPYYIPHQEVIGALHMNRGAWANANFFADGYANFGLIGSFLATLALGFIFRLLDAVATRQSPRLTLLSIAGIMPAISNTGVLTVILSNGLLAVLALLFFAPRVIPSEAKSATKPLNSAQTP
ncbi:MAG: hypothetical protein HQ503_10085 [Rhodospirillales bacterium]|nr:hypothetical protein [Rhodospirillales bacterium]